MGCGDAVCGFVLCCMGDWAGCPLWEISFRILVEFGVGVVVWIDVCDYFCWAEECDFWGWEKIPAYFRKDLGRFGFRFMRSISRKMDNCCV